MDPYALRASAAGGEVADGGEPDSLPGVTGTRGGKPEPCATCLLARAALGAELVANSTAGYDLLTKDGQRVQVKGRRLTPKSRPSHFSPLRGLDDGRHFDVLIAVLLEEDFQVAGAWQATWATVQSVARWRKRLNGHLLYLTDVQKDPRFERLALG